ncbi:MAG: hypothetical protein QOI26_2221 [Pseudonocardiales bacterium]|nr:hypothetical protein [Pseudonocardiales bacterium]
MLQRTHEGRDGGHEVVEGVHRHYVLAQQKRRPGAAALAGPALVNILDQVGVEGPLAEVIVGATQLPVLVHDRDVPGVESVARRRGQHVLHGLDRRHQLLPHLCQQVTGLLFGEVASDAQPEAELLVREFARIALVGERHPPCHLLAGSTMGDSDEGQRVAGVTPGSAPRAAAASTGTTASRSHVPHAGSADRSPAVTSWTGALLPLPPELTRLRGCQLTSLRDDPFPYPALARPATSSATYRAPATAGRCPREGLTTWRFLSVREVAPECVRTYVANARPRRDGVRNLRPARHYGAAPTSWVVLLRPELRVDLLVGIAREVPMGKAPSVGGGARPRRAEKSAAWRCGADWMGLS